MSTNSVIRIKRSATAGSPPVLAAGELAYSALEFDGTNGGDRLYIGFGTETNGNAAERIVIGGKYFTDLLDHTRGVLTADSAILVDENKKINELFVDDLILDDNELSTIDNTDILITPDGTGKTVIKNIFVDDDQTSLEDFIIDVSQDAIVVEGTANEIDVAESTVNSTQTYTVSLADIFSADTFGSATQIPVITVDSKGRITAVALEDISTELAVSGDTGLEDVSLLDGTLNVVTGTEPGISVDVTKTADDVFATISLDQGLATTSSPTFNELTLTSGDLFTTSSTASVFTDATTVSIGAGSGTTTINNDAVVAGDLTVQGTLTSLETVNLQTEDPLVKFGEGNPADSFSIGFYGEYVSNGSPLKAGVFRDHVSKEFFIFKDLDADIQGNQIDANAVDLADLNIANLGVTEDIVAAGDITGDQINATLFVGTIDGGTY